MSLARQPIFWVNLVKALVAVAVVFGVQITDDEAVKIGEVIALIAVFIGGHVIQHEAVTPVAAPALPEGKTVTVLDPVTGKPAGVTTVVTPDVDVPGGDDAIADSVGGAG